MLANVLFLFAISSGSALAAVLWKKEYEDVLPLTISGIILIQFFMGLVGFLEAGFIVALSVMVFLWGAALFALARKKDRKGAIRLFFSHGFWLFLILYGGFNLVLRGMKMYALDEFSHWGTVVKAMVQTDCLGTVPQAHLTHGDYTPGMALFQYFFQKIYLAAGGDSFSEWRLYLAYIVLGISFVLPLVKRVAGKSFKRKLIIALVFFLLPLSFYRECYQVLYIDPLLGILFGAGLAMTVASQGRQDRYRLLYFLSACFMLPLMKVSGILLAICIAVAYVADYGLHAAVSRKDTLKRMGIFALAIGAPKLLWDFLVDYSETRSAISVSFRFTDFCNILAGKDDTYRGTAFNLFKTALFNNTTTEGNTNFFIGDSGISISYFTLLVIFAIMIYFSWYMSGKNSRGKGTSLLTAAWSSAGVWLIFYVSLGVMYLFGFSEVEALRLASYSRYTHAVYLGMYMLAVTAILGIILERYSGTAIFVLILGITLLLTPMESVAKILFRDTVRRSIAQREGYLELSGKIRDFSQPYDDVFFVCQHEQYGVSGSAYLMISFEVRPVVIDQIDEGWVMAPESTDWYISDKNAAQLRQLLLDSYDYVALYMLDDYFCATFSGLFEDPGDIGENRVYKVDKKSGLLELCG